MEGKSTSCALARDIQERQVLMGLLFLRYVADAFENRYRELKAEGYGDEEDEDIAGYEV